MLNKKRLAAMTMSAVMAVSLLAGCGSGDTGTTAGGTTAAPAATTAAPAGTEKTEAGGSTAAATTAGSAASYDLDQVNTKNYVLAHSGSPGSTNDYYGEQFANLVKEKSGGKMTIDIYNASQLGSDTSAAADVQAGAIDFQITSPAAIPNVVPESAVFDMPFLFNTVEDARKVLLNQEFFDDMSDAFAKQKLKLFPFTDQGFRSITTNTEITGIESFNGMTLRTMNNPHHIAWFTALGVAATPLNTSEIYLALQQGMLSGQENPWSQAYDKGLYDVQKYITNSNHVLYVGCMYTGTDMWANLTETEQQIFWDAATECVEIVQKHTDSYENEMLDKLIKECGMTFVDFDQIPGLRDALKEKTFDVAYKSISEAIGKDLLDQFLTAAGYGDQIPQ